MATVECEICGEELQRKPSIIKKAKHHFCSLKCKGEWQSINIAGENHPRWKDDLIQLKCDECGKLFERPRHAIKKNKHHFCNRKCMGKWRATHMAKENHPSWNGGLIEVHCAQCGKIVERAKHEVERSVNHFCDTICAGKWRETNIIRENHPRWAKVEVKCAQCGTMLERDPSVIKHHERSFCDMMCLGKWASANTARENSPRWKGGTKPYYGQNWQHQRRRARERDNYRCQHCHIDEKDLYRELDVHHIIPFREFCLERYKEANKLVNLISLCHSCHQKVENGNIEIQPYLV